jgi:hypothetical protein
MTELTEPNPVSALRDRLDKLDGDLRDFNERLRALEKRLDHDDEVRDSIRELAEALPAVGWPEREPPK